MLTAFRTVIGVAVRGRARVAEPGRLIKVIKTQSVEAIV